MTHNPANEPTDAEVAECIKRHNLKLPDPTYEGLVEYQKLQGWTVEPSNYVRDGWPDQQIKIKDQAGNVAYGLSDNIHRSFLIALDRYLDGQFGRDY